MGTAERQSSATSLATAPMASEHALTAKWRTHRGRASSPLAAPAVGLAGHSYLHNKKEAQTEGDEYRREGPGFWPAARSEEYDEL